MNLPAVSRLCVSDTNPRNVAAPVLRVTAARRVTRLHVRQTIESEPLPSLTRTRLRHPHAKRPSSFDMTCCCCTSACFQDCRCTRRIDVSRLFGSTFGTMISWVGRIGKWPRLIKDRNKIALEQIASILKILLRIGNRCRHPGKGFVQKSGNGSLFSNGLTPCRDRMSRRVFSVPPRQTSGAWPR